MDHVKVWHLVQEECPVLEARHQEARCFVEGHRGHLAEVGVFTGFTEAEPRGTMTLL